MARAARTPSRALRRPRVAARESLGLPGGGLHRWVKVWLFVGIVLVLEVNRALGG